MNANAALLLLADSRFPTGAHAHSAGIEASAARGDVRDVTDRGDEFVVNGVINARGKISDIALQGDCEYVIAFRDSKAVRIRFLTRTAPVLPPQEATDAA